MAIPDYKRCLICGSTCNANAEQEKKDNHHVLFEIKRKYISKTSSEWYTSSWKRAFTIPLCRRCHSLYHKIYKEPTPRIESLIYQLPPQIIQFTVEYVNANHIQEILDDAIQSSFISQLISREFWNKDYQQTCDKFNVSYGNLYQKLLPMLYPALTEIPNIEIFPERIPHFKSNPVLEIPNIVKPTIKYPSISMEDKINKYIIQSLTAVGGSRRSEESIVKYTKIKLKKPKLQNKRIIKNISQLCDNGIILKEEDTEKNIIFYKRAQIGGGTQSSLF